MDVQQLQQLLQQLNWVDWGVLLIVALSTFSGTRRGFVLGALDLLGVAVALAVALLGYRPVAELVPRLVDIPAALARLGALLGIFVLAQGIYSAVVDLLFALSRPLRRLLGPLDALDRGLGVLPGVAKGLMYAALLMLPFAMFPLSPPISVGIERSALASRLVSTTVGLAPALDALVGRELAESLTLMTPPQTQEGVKTNLGPLGRLEPDPSSEEQMLALVNQERTRAGLQPLRWDEQLRDVGRGHSREMFEQGYFAHVSPNTGTAADRLQRAGVPFTGVGENLAYAPNVRVAHEGLMNSPGHRANILRPNFTRLGIGAIRSELRGRMFTQVFAE